MHSTTQCSYSEKNYALESLLSLLCGEVYVASRYGVRLATQGRTLVIMSKSGLHHNSPYETIMVYLYYSNGCP
jgi:hypothetical protein